MSDLAPFDPERLVRVLAEHDVRYVLIGALAARLQGFPRLTADMDITPDPDRGNVERLAAALRALDARVFTEGAPGGLTFDCSSATLSRADLWNLVTDAGRIDVVFTPAGTEGYADLHGSAVRFDVFGVTLEVAALDDIIRSKTASDRPQDRQDVPVLRELRRRLSQGGPAAI